MNNDPADSGHAVDLGDAGQSGVYFVTTSDLDVLEAGAGDSGVAIHRIALTDCDGKLALLQALGAALAFPQGMGRNWDGLADALNDLEWLGPAQPRALLFEDAGDLLAVDQPAFDTLVDILEDACARWREAGLALWAFLALPESEFADTAAGDGEPPPPLH